MDYSSIEGLPEPVQTIRFIVKRLSGRPLLVAQCRIQLYEGWSAHDVVNIQFTHAIGIKKLILTKAAGTLNSGTHGGTFESRRPAI